MDYIKSEPAIITLNSSDSVTSYNGEAMLNESSEISNVTIKNEIHTQEDIEIPIQEFAFKYEIKYENVLKMTCMDAFECLENVINFCEAKNEVDMQEILILQGIKNRMLKECGFNIKSKHEKSVERSYENILQLLEILIAFLKLRCEIFLEEYLILRRTRDKIHWKCL